MNDFTIISYSGPKENALLSLIESSSRYMLPFCGRFRIVDFTIRNSIASDAKRTIIYNNTEDDLEDYVENYGPFKGVDYPPIKVVNREFSDIRFCYNLVMHSNSAYYIIYNGDNPSIIDFKSIVERYKKKGTAAMLFKLKVGGNATMAYTILVSRRKNLLNIINYAIDKDMHAPNIFEMIINIMINRGIIKESIDAHYWPITDIPGYYALNMKILMDPVLSRLVQDNPSIRSYVKGDGVAIIRENANVKNSFLSDSCKIAGTVENSIISPGVVIEDNSVIKDSIILPNIKIGYNSRITKTIIDERSGINSDQQYLDIGNRCRIGSGDNQLKNNEFPASLYQSITLIGKNCRIPDESNIGGACYIASGKAEKHFRNSKYLYDGLSIT